MKNLKLFKSGFCEKLKLLLIPIGLLIGSLTMQAWSTEYKRIYFDKSRWNGDNATIWARAFKSADNSQKFDYKFVNVYSGDIMYLDVDTQYDKIVFVRNNASATAISWSGDAFWGKTGDLTIADGNLYILSDYKNNYSNGWWTTTMPIRGGTMYLDNSYLNWTPAGTQEESKDNIQFFHGNNSYDYTYVETDMANITNTLLYYTNVGGPSIASYVRFAKAQYTSGGFNDDNVPTYATGTYCSEGYTFSSGDLYIFTTNADGSTITPHYQDGGYTAMNKTITLAAKIKATGSDSYVAGTSKGQLGASSYTFSNYNTCTTTSGNASVVAVGGTSGTFSAGYTANTTLTVSSVNGNYTFKGWFDADGNKLSDNTTYEGYRPKSTTTVYAYFEEKTYNVTAVASPAAGGSVTPTSATAFGRVSGGAIAASYNEGYYFTGWSGGSGTYGNASENNTTFTPSADNQTVTANFGYTWCVKGDFPNEEPFSVEHLLEHVGKNASNKDTCCLEITLPANTTFDFKIFARDYSTWWSCSSHEAKTVYTYTSHGPHTCYNDNENKNMTITTAGAGTYKFAWNITDRLLTIYYPTSYKVTYDANGGSGDAPTDDDYYASGATVTVKGAGSLTKTGYAALAYWTAAEGGGTEYAITTGTFSITANKTLYAKWAQNITLNQNGADESGSTSLSATYKATLSTAGLENPKKIGYAFAGWATAASDGTIVINPDGTVNTVASWTDSDKKWIHDAATTLYATWVADNNTFTNAKNNGDWNDPDNWSAGVVPTNSYAAVQLSGELNVSSYIHVGSMDLTASGAKLTIQAGGTLEVAGAITNTNPDKLVIQTGNEGQGALIYDITQTAPHAIVNMTTKNAAGSHYQYIASPIGGVSVADVFSGKGAYTYVWKEGIGWERRGYYDDIAAFEPIALKGKGSCSFVGQLYPSTTSLSLSYTGTPTNADAQGVNMLANALTAPIKIAAMTISGSSDGSVHVWNNGTWDHYAVASAGENVIPAMQVYAILASSSGSVSFDYTTAVRGASNKNAALKAPKRIASDIPEHITISVRTNERDIDLQLYEDEMFTNEIDKGWEAIYMEGDGRFGELYAQADEKMSILATPDLEGTILGFAPGETSDYTISFNGDGKGYYLNDMKELKSTLISEGNTYMFSPDESTNATRFVISRTPIHKVPTGTENVSAGTNARKQMINGTLYIIRDGRIYNAEGALVK